jgi:ferric-dicitrate binding protein FerR (iron transport regulator)
LILTGEDGHALFQVSDGSTFEVYPNSRVVFRKNPPNWKDLLDVLVGRVRIHIEHLGNAPNPNRVVTPTAVISVRGTTFDVSVNDDDETTLVEVEEGLVEVQHALLPRGNPKMLSSGDSIRVYKSEPLEARAIDKGTVIRQVFHSVMDAVTTIATRAPRSVGSIGGSGGDVGDTGKKVPPPPPPLPPPPPPVPLH